MGDQQYYHRKPLTADTGVVPQWDQIAYVAGVSTPWALVHSELGSSGFASEIWLYASNSSQNSPDGPRDSMINIAWCSTSEETNVGGSTIGFTSYPDEGPKLVIPGLIMPMGTAILAQQDQNVDFDTIPNPYIVLYGYVNYITEPTG